MRMAVCLFFTFVTLSVLGANLEQVASSKFPIADGLERTQFRKADGTLSVNVLTADLHKIQIRSVLATDQLIGQETTSSMAQRYGALAAINGGNSVSNDAWRLDHGDPNGFMSLNGQVVSEPYWSAQPGFLARSSFAFSESTTRPQEMFLDRVQLSLSLKIGDHLTPLKGINRLRKPDDLVLYTPEWNASTLTNQNGVEAVVRSGHVLSVRPGGSSKIPGDGFVVSASGKQAQWLTQALSSEADIEIKVNLSSGFDGQDLPLQGYSYISAGPAMLRNGKPVSYTNEEDRGSEKYSTGKEPRTVLAFTAGQAKLYAAVFDGEDDSKNEGATLQEVVDFFLWLDPTVTDIYNLDGGGSSTMVVGQTVVSQISNWMNEWPTGKKKYVERRRSDAILFLAK